MAGLRDFTALSFDCYGTLIDWESGMMAGLAPLLDRLEAFPGRDAVLEAHARHESAQQRQTPAMPYSSLLAVVYKRLAEEWRLQVSWDESVRYGQSVAAWPAFPDSREALAYLGRHYRLIILSNVDNASFAGSQARLGVAFDVVCTAEDIGHYKPDGRNFSYMMERLAPLGIGAETLLHTAESMFHDHVPAAEAGLARCHIFRRHDKPGFGATMTPASLPEPQFRFNSLAAMAEAHQQENA